MGEARVAPVAADIPARAFLEVLRDSSASLKFLAELGVAGFDLSEKSLAILASWERRSLAPAQAAPDFFNQFIKCRQCPWSPHRRRVVPGRGNARARLALVGGLPEPEDMATLKPWSGKAGALLDKMIGAMGFSRDDVYLTFSVKCRHAEGDPAAPPDPPAAVIHCCRAYLRKEMVRLRPDVIIAFGDIAMTALLETAQPMARLRGRFHDFMGSRLMPTHGPEYLLENPEAKREAWEDIKQVMAALKARE